MTDLNDTLEAYPAVSVILNTHNSEKTPELLKRSLESVKCQRFDQTWELLVVCDGDPADNIKDTMKEFVDSEGSQVGDLFTLHDGTSVPLKFFGAGEVPSGYQCYPKNQGIVVSAGEFICFLDHDNEFTPDHLQVLWNAMHEGSVWPDFTYGRRKYLVDFSDDVKTEVTMPDGTTIELEERDSPYVEWTPENIQRLQQPMTNFIDTSDFMIAKGALWRTHLATKMMWNEDKRRFGDWELIARMVFFAGVRGKGVDHIVQHYHWTGDNMQLTRPVNEVPQKKAI